MKTIDLSKSVMNRVVKFEKRRSIVWLSRLIIFIVILIVSLVGVLWLITREVIERKTLVLLELFAEDREIINEFWQDTILTFWEELPQEQFALTVVILLSLMMAILLSRQKLKVVIRRIKQLTSLKKEEK